MQDLITSDLLIGEEATLFEINEMLKTWVLQITCQKILITHGIKQNGANKSIVQRLASKGENDCFTVWVKNLHQFQIIKDHQLIRIKHVKSGETLINFIKPC